MTDGQTKHEQETRDAVRVMSDSDLCRALKQSLAQPKDNASYRLEVEIMRDEVLRRGLA